MPHGGQLRGQRREGRRCPVGRHCQQAQCPRPHSDLNLAVVSGSRKQLQCSPQPGPPFLPRPPFLPSPPGSHSEPLARAWFQPKGQSCNQGPGLTDPNGQLALLPGRAPRHGYSPPTALLRGGHCLGARAWRAPRSRAGTMALACLWPRTWSPALSHAPASLPPGKVSRPGLWQVGKPRLGKKCSAEPGPEQTAHQRR